MSTGLKPSLYCALLAVCAAGFAQPLPVWKEPAQARRYIEASGRRAAIFGNGAGLFEAWVFPIKVLHDFRLLFQIEGSLERVEADSLASQVEVTPAATTITYSHAAFTVKETLWAPHDEPALVIELEVESSKGLTVYTQFRNDLKPMWPASLGGQYNAWLKDQNAMLLAEPTRRASAVIGSPAFDAFTDEGDHMLPDRPTVLRLKPFAAGKGRAVVVIAGKVASGQSPAASETARAVFTSVLEKRDALRAGLETHWRDFLARTTQLETPDPVFNRAFLWGKIAMEKGFACNDGLGCGLIAGYGPSGTSERPGFGWYFGGDALMNVPALLDYGDFEGARTALEFLRKRQRADGKMMHEMTMSAALMEAQGADWFKLPYAYYHADTTPLYLVAANAYFQRTGDKRFFEEFWPSLKKAYEYCLTTVDNDGLMSNLKAGMAAVETGVLRGKVQKDIYLQGFWLAALEAVATMAASTTEPETSAQADTQLVKARESLNTWFSEKEQRFPFGALTDNSRLDALTAWPAVALAYGGLEKRKAGPAADALNRPELATDWGVRWVATDSGLYNPLGYNDGSVWPFMTGYVIQALYRQNRDFAAFQQLSAMAGLTGFAGAGWMPENFSGDRLQALPHSVPHQLFSTGVGFIQATMSGMLGLNRLRLAPQLPADWDFVKVKNYRDGGERIDFELRRTPTGLKLSTSAKLEYAAEPVRPIELLPLTASTTPGERSVRPRLLSRDCNSESCTYVFAGRSGSEHDLRYRLQGKVVSRTLKFPASDKEFSTVQLRVP